MLHCHMSSDKQHRSISRLACLRLTAKHNNSAATLPTGSSGPATAPEAYKRACRRGKCRFVANQHQGPSQAEWKRCRVCRWCCKTMKCCCKTMSRACPYKAHDDFRRGFPLSYKVLSPLAVITPGSAKNTTRRLERSRKTYD